MITKVMFYLENENGELLSNENQWVEKTDEVKLNLFHTYNQAEEFAKKFNEDIEIGSIDVYWGLYLHQMNECDISEEEWSEISDEIIVSDEFWFLTEEKYDKSAKPAEEGLYIGFSGYEIYCT